MAMRRLFDRILEHIDVVLAQNTVLGVGIMARVTQAHPVDIAEFLE